MRGISMKGRRLSWLNRSKRNTTAATSMVEKMGESGSAPVEDSTQVKKSRRASESAKIMDEGLANDSAKIKSSSQAKDKAQLNDGGPIADSGPTKDINSAQIDDSETTPIHICPAFDIREPILDNVRVLFPILQNKGYRLSKETPPPSSTPDFNLIVTGVGTAISAYVVYHEAEAMSDEFCVFLSVGPRSSPEVALHELLGFIMMLSNRQTFRHHENSRMHRWDDFRCYVRSKDPDR
ncbi:hypothetical protein EJ03DRAFT_55210 [Teratosphaeria nubilosa]|uniref:Uncharacterized protein n=1 Tax=Teratosphaeria nubilosa TaxID=161662 RepID=A0A6G1LDW4_9PEZI|nr:hypothetical protein EJ03DRAFT_55210 [Teratosphaeria nubilosa]